MPRIEEPIRHLEELKEDLMKVYREVASKYECKDNQEAFRMCVEHPAPRFYVDPRRAHQRLSPMFYGDRSKIDCLPPLKREMYEELFAVVMKLKQKSAYWNKSLNYVLRFAVLEPAPRFYITPIRMRQIWAEKTKRKKKEMIS